MTPSHVIVLVDEIQTPDFLILLGATVAHELNEHPECLIQFRQPPSSRYFCEGLIGKRLVVRAIGADGAELELFSGILRQIDAEWELNGSCLIALIGIGSSYKLDTFNRSQTFNVISLQDTAARLLGSQSGDFVCSEPPPLNMLQFNETDWSFLHRVVDRHGGFLRVAGDRVDIYDEFQPPSINLVWRAENGLHQFRTTGKVAPYLLFGANFENATATSRQWDVEIAEVAAEDSLPEIRAGALAGSNANSLASGLWNRFLSSTHARFEQELQLESKRQIIHSCTAYGEAQTPEIVVGNKISVSGDLEAAGTYGVYKLIHEWVPGAGYRNRFWCTPYTQYLNPTRPQPTRYYGPEIARVVETTWSDQKIARVRVAFLWQEHNETGWLTVITPNAGSSRGFYFMPEVGDQVYVLFQGGDPSKPYVAGSVWNGVDQPPLEDLHGGEYDNNDIKRIVTKSGNRLVFDDKPGQETMVMATPNHVRVSMFDGGSTLLLHSDGDIHINAGGTVHMKCSKFLREIG